MPKELNFKNKKILIFGLGLQGGGVGDAQYLHDKGAIIRVTDAKSESQLSSSLAKLPSDISLSLGAHQNSDIDWADIIIKNPGVPDDHPSLIYAKGQGKSIYTSIAVVVEQARDKVIGITGTRGKSTTTELIYQVLSRAYPGRVEKGGNIPDTSALSLLDHLADLDYLVLELSSFQLAGLHQLHISPHIAVITNMYPDHLNRYPDMEAYFYDKSALTKYQGKNDICIAYGGNDYSQKLAHLSGGQYVSYSPDILPAGLVTSLPGLHNQENLSAVFALSRELGIKDDLVKNVIKDFHGLPFRLETRATINGVTYINDTTATTPTATIKAIDSLNKPTIIILGGDTKKLPYDQLLLTLSRSKFIKKVIILGSKNIPDFVKQLKEVMGNRVAGEYNNMREAIDIASQLSTPGDVVLLSPGFASFDLFINEFDRGRQFNDCIANLQNH